LFVATGNGHADCAMGWFSGMVLVPVVAAGVGLVGLLVRIPSHVTVFVVSLPAMVSLAGVAWSSIRHLTRALFTRWEALTTPLIVDDVVSVVAGSLGAYFLTTPW
jgi:uncharacterized membrane protein YhhN